MFPVVCDYNLCLIQTAVYVVKLNVRKTAK